MLLKSNYIKINKKIMFIKEISETAKKVFNEYDKNEDGVLSIEELKP